MPDLLGRLHESGRADHTAIEAGNARITYGRLGAAAAALAGRLHARADWAPGACVAFLAPPGPEYVETLLGIFCAGGVAVPLSPLHTTPEIAYVLDDAQPIVLLTTPPLAARLAEAAPALPLEAIGPVAFDDGHARAPAAPPAVLPAASAPALMLYTSGTTGRPKGVILSHAAVAATLASLDGAWGWRADDRLLHVLPLHHTHGVIVALAGALWAGATVRFAPFDARGTWDDLRRASVFMAVPTIYAKLMEAFNAAPAAQQAVWCRHAAGLRLFTSGSSALPATLFHAFTAATGQVILERYGMTEIGMALSNPLEGPRVPGAVGRPLPGVTVDIATDDGRAAAIDEPGELRVRTPQLFSEYHRDPESTVRSFDPEGRFRTGDTGVRDRDGIVRLLGRTSLDILKSGGYKLSALEIEEALREHPQIAEVAVVGVPDDTWGDRVTACVVVRDKEGAALDLDALRAWCKERLAPYKIPRALIRLERLPRNAMGKVQKSVLKSKLC